MKTKTLLLSLLGLAVLLLIVMSACRQPMHQAQWGQGYEAEYTGLQGAPPVYYQPDHSYLYSWMMYHMLFQNSAPTYHVYYPPVGYPPTYRPWQPPSPAVVRPTIPIAPPPSFRTSGGFSETPSKKPDTLRSGGGFATPVSKTPDIRSGGGFSPPAAARPAAPTPSPRSSGGFSPTRPSSSPRSSGGFGKR